MILAKIDRNLWLEKYAKDAHKSVFGHEYPDFDTSLFDYALLVIDKASNTPISYVLVRHIQSHHFYIEYGGSFPDFRGGVRVHKSFNFILEEMAKQGFQICTLMTHVDNIPMQKLALHCGFKVFGLTQGRYGLCLEYRLNLKQEEK